MKEEIKLLIEKAEKSIKAAEELLAKDYFEFSVSRSYYAMLYCAQALLLSKNLIQEFKLFQAFGRDQRFWKRIDKEWRNSRRVSSISYPGFQRETESGLRCQGGHNQRKGKGSSGKGEKIFGTKSKFS
jgi:hypothetical protein